MENIKLQLQKFLTEQGVKSQKDKALLIEAYRRILISLEDHKLNEIWIGLGTKTQYKSEFFKCVFGEPRPFNNNWWKLSEKGVEILEKIMANFPKPDDQAKINQICILLF